VSENPGNAEDATAKLIDSLAERAEAAEKLVADFQAATRNGVFHLTRDETLRARGESLMDRADALLGLNRAGEPAKTVP